VNWFANDRHCFLLAVACYGISMLYTVFLWRRGFRKDNRINYLLLLLGFGLHTAAMFLRGYRLNRCPISNLYEATLFSMWALVGMYLIIGWWSRLQFLGAFASPVLFCVGVFALMPGLDTPASTVRPEVPAVVTSLHASLLALAYGAFGLSFAAAVMYLVQERNLKFHKLRAVFSLMPPIQRLERAVGILIVIGFCLLTVGLGLGAFGLGHLGQPGIYRGDPKIVWSAVVWLLYMGLIIMRWKFAQGGRRLAFGAIGSFGFILLTFWGTNLVSPLHHP